MDLYLYFIGPFIITMVIQGYFAKKFKGKGVIRHLPLLPTFILLIFGVIQYKQASPSMIGLGGLALLFYCASALCTFAGYLMGWFIYLMMNRKVKTARNSRKSRNE